MYVVDASVWVSRFFPEDIHHEASRSWLMQTLQHRIILVAPALLPPELVGAITRRSGMPALGRNVLDEILRIHSLRIVPIDHRLGRASALAAAEFRLRGADAVYVALARHLGLPLVTWDREQRLRAGQAVTTMLPDHL